MVAENDAAKVAHYSLSALVSRFEHTWRARAREPSVLSSRDRVATASRRPMTTAPLPPSFSPLLPPALHTIVSAPKCARSSRSESSERTTFSPLRPTYLDVSLCTRPNARPRVRSCVRTPCYSLRSNASFHLLPGERTLR